jgi:hypothetical protein
LSFNPNNDRAQTEDDKKVYQNMVDTIGTYVQAKLDADVNLVGRTAFDWFILRPTWLTDEPGTGKVALGKTHTKPAIPVRFFFVTVSLGSQIPVLMLLRITIFEARGCGERSGRVGRQPKSEGIGSRYGRRGHTYQAGCRGGPRQRGIRFLKSQRNPTL